MLVKINTAAVQGLEAIPVTSEVNTSRGYQFNLVGLPDNAVKESHQRIVAAIHNSGFKFPSQSITVNLTPADLKKEGSAYDLPIAIGILATQGELNIDGLPRYLMVGELSLDGSLLPIRGALPIAIMARQKGYEGLIVSDCWAIHNFYEPGRHGYSEDVEHAVAAAIHTGTDLNCGNTYAHIPDAVQQGLLDEADVDRSLVRLISERIRLGEMMHNTTPWDHLYDDIVEGSEHRALSRKMAEESIVLLQNRDNILPLKADTRVALVGPNGNDREMMWGNYNPIPGQTVTLMLGLQARIPDLVTIKGCDVVGGKVKTKKILRQLEGIDVVVFAGGISPMYEGEEMDVDAPGFRGGDRTSIELPAVQRELVKALHEAGKKVVLVNFSGSAMGLVPETETCDAIVQAWYPGEEGGTVLADILYGQVAPSGKLPVTFYKNVDQLPDFEDYNMKGRTYRYFEGEPLYPFGFGLSYTTFAYGEARIDGNKIVIPVNNNGSCIVTEVVQLYVRKADDAEGPIKSLRGFQRVTIPAGQTVEVSFLLTEETFLSWNEEKQNMVPAKGKWELLYGGNSHDVKKIEYDYE